MKAAIGLAALSVLVTAAAQDPRSTRVDAVFADISANAPGCAVGIYRQGQLVLARSYGLANVEEGRKITPLTTFDLGSAAKPYTALATLMLEEQGRLSLDDRVRRYVPELPDYTREIRIRDLLQHTSGLRDYGSLERLSGRDVKTMPEFLALLASQQRLNFEPGTQHEYSHSDFNVLGIVIERVVREPFGAFLEREVLRPMGMTGTRVHDARGVRVPERAYGHNKSDAGFAVIFPSSRITGGENVYTSVTDLARWDRALEEAATGRRPLLAKMLERPALPNGETIPYAYGLRLERYRGLRTVARGGHPKGMTAEFVLFPDQRLSVATLCNGEHLNAGERGKRVAEIYLGTQMEPRKPLPPLPPETQAMPSDVHKYVGYYKSPDWLDYSRFGVVNGKLVEFLVDTHQTMTYRGGGVFTADGSPGDFRLLFTPTNSRGGMRLEYFSEGESGDVAERVADADLWRPTPAALAEYSGTYLSEELNVVWQLAERDGDLVIRRPGTPDAPLVPMQPDVFSRGFGFWAEPLVARIEFKRDPAGRVTHFAITTPPGEDVVRDLRFLRAKSERE